MILLRTKRECQPPKALCLSILILTLFWLLFVYQKRLFSRVLNLRCDSLQMMLGFCKLVFRYPHFTFNSPFLRGFYCLHFWNAVKKKTHIWLKRSSIERVLQSVLNKKWNTLIITNVQNSCCHKKNLNDTCFDLWIVFLVVGPVSSGYLSAG